MHEHLSLCVASKRLPGKRSVRAIKLAAIAACLVAMLISSAGAQERSPDLREQPYAGPLMPELATATKKPVVMPGTLVIPTTSQLNAADHGRKAHTNVRYIVPATASPLVAPPYSGDEYETPQSLACIYGVVTAVAGCNPNVTTNTPAGGSQTIAIVDAFDDPEAAADLAYFSAQFGLPFSPSTFQVVYASGFAPEVDPTGGWELEEALDIEYAHAMAPNAKLYLVEANSNSDNDLITAVIVAADLVQCGKTTTCPTGSTGKGEISMSWGSAEYSGQTVSDAAFNATNVVYVASAGDAPGVSWPCASPNVVCAGGTSTARSLATGNLEQEIAWSDAGGGVSAYEAVPTYQSTYAPISTMVGTKRGTPDISSDANPNTGVWVYDTFPMDYGYSWYTWLPVGGTSVSAPTITGIINAAGHFAVSSAAELSTIYANRANAADYFDVTYGYCGYYSGSVSTTGWDLCTGVGTPRGLAGK